MPAFLTGEALVVYLKLPSDKRTCKDVKAALVAAFSPPEQQSEYLLAFERLTLRDGESPRNFLFELRRLLDLAMPALDAVAREKLLLHHFINGLPADINAAIRISQDCLTSEAALKRAVAWMHVKRAPPGPVAAAADDAARDATITRDATDVTSRLEELERQMMCLRVGGTSADAPQRGAVAAVTPARPKQQASSGRYSFAPHSDGDRTGVPRGPQCFLCMGFGHLARQCANNSLRIANGAQQGRVQHQGNGRGAAAFRGTAGRF